MADTSRGRNEELSEMLEAIDMEAYLDSEGIDYKVTHGRSGTQLNLKECPFCGGDKWKVYMGQDTGLGNCFSGSCPEGTFNKWSFIKMHLDADNRSTVQHIKDFTRELGWTPVKRHSERTVESFKSPKLPESDLVTEAEYPAFLKMRGIKPYIAEYFGLRNSEFGRFHFEGGSQDYSDRIIIPIYTADGVLASFQGRDVTDTSEKKYLFPPGFSSTGVYLYNAHNYVGQEDVVMNEGVFDVFATKQAFDESEDMRDILAIGSFGKNLSYGTEISQLAEFLKLKNRGLKRVTIMWDGEKSALKSAILACELLAGIGLQPFVALLPQGKDPNEVEPTIVRQAYWKRKKYSKMAMMKLMMTAYK